MRNTRAKIREMTGERLILTVKDSTTEGAGQEQHKNEVEDVKTTSRMRLDERVTWEKKSTVEGMREDHETERMSENDHRKAVICPDPWRSGAREEATSDGRKKGENKLLTTRQRYSPYGGRAALGVNQKCQVLGPCSPASADFIAQVCLRQLPSGGKWCQECAHRKGRLDVLAC
eukprot:761841-Hanusia_phi.AAC.10